MSKCRVFLPISAMERGFTWHEDRLESIVFGPWIPWKNGEGTRVFGDVSEILSVDGRTQA